jgi:hypothetical protein
MPLTEVTQPAQQIAQITAVVVGGAWAYVKFFRGRVFRPRAELHITASLAPLGADSALLAQLSMKNEGLSRIILQPDLAMVKLDVLRAKRCQSGANPAWDEDVMVSPVFRAHSWLEPGETLAEELIIAPPEAEAVAYRLRPWVRSPRRLHRDGVAWEANCVVPVAGPGVTAGSVVHARANGAEVLRP